MANVSSSVDDDHVFEGIMKGVWGAGAQPVVKPQPK
jgi:hypothetical protein